jgi:YD repeat-containing protein
VGDTSPYTFVDLILADGTRIHFNRIDGGSGTDFTVAVYEHTSTPTRFFKSQISWNGSGWDLKLKDGTLYKFRDGFGATRPGQAGMIRMQDRNGNAHDITRDTNGNVIKITSFPSGRWIEFTNDGSNRITQAKDNTGRLVSYTYFPTGQLQTVTDPNGGIWEYTYDTLSRMLTVNNPRGIIVTTNNEFDAAGKVTRQTLADGGVFTLPYTLNGNGKTIQTDVTDPRNIVRRVTFNTDGYSLSETRGLGTPEEQVTTYERQAGTNLLLSMTDALGRKTAYLGDVID